MRFRKEIIQSWQYSHWFSEEHKYFINWPQCVLLSVNFSCLTDIASDSSPQLQLHQNIELNYWHWHMSQHVPSPSIIGKFFIFIFLTTLAYSMNTLNKNPCSKTIFPCHSAAGLISICMWCACDTLTATD